MPQFAANIDLSTLNGRNGCRTDGIYGEGINPNQSGDSASSAGDFNGDCLATGARLRRIIFQ